MKIAIAVAIVSILFCWEENSANRNDPSIGLTTNYFRYKIDAMEKPIRGRPRERMTDKPLGKRVARLKERGLNLTEIGAELGVTRQRAAAIYARLRAEQSTGRK